MEQSIIDIKTLSEEDIWKLTEEDVFNLVETLKTCMKKEESMPYFKLIDSAFEFRTISARRRDLKQDLSKAGFKFFKREVNHSNQLVGIYKRTSANKTFYS